MRTIEEKGKKIGVVSRGFSREGNRLGVVWQGEGREIFLAPLKLARCAKFTAFDESFLPCEVGQSRSLSLRPVGQRRSGHEGPLILPRESGRQTPPSIQIASYRYTYTPLHHVHTVQLAKARFLRAEYKFFECYPPSEKSPPLSPSPYGGRRVQKVQGSRAPSRKRRRESHGRRRRAKISPPPFSHDYFFFLPFPLLCSVPPLAFKCVPPAAKYSF